MYHGKFLILNFGGVVKDEVTEVEEEEEKEEEEKEVKEIFILVEDTLDPLSNVNE